MSGDEVAVLYADLEAAVRELYRVARVTGDLLDAGQARPLLSAAALVDGVTSKVARRIAEGRL